MKNKAVFLDRDGTINIDKDYLFRKEDFEYLDGAVEGLRILQEAGYLLIIVTNQSGIARGFYSEEEYKQLEQWMIEDLKAKGVSIAKCYYCPHHPQASVQEYRVNCKCRKPELGLFEEAIRELNVDVVNSFAIGDRLRDLAICNKICASGNKERICGYQLYTQPYVEGCIKGIGGGLLEAANEILLI
ncbi:D-glycero-alpha-D-manno-heptose-1,7-bisphosphate 7-phosphatase [Butyrivibrio fibrisolvens]|uniref:D-glycero-alpha-D-manno-heptose-1,7-bisphosphate 7-phosphatase n=1 Tax=Butyrivibrio fibrisolvens TaxID=831 RepID=UPI0004256DC7|nr:HAD family hydrolase [Butyrivibrio fibrisolvens]